MLSLTLLALPALAQDRPVRPAPAPPPPQDNQLTIAYVEVAGDARYEPIRDYTRLILKHPQHPYPGAEIGIDDARVAARVLKTDFMLERITVASPEAVAPAVLQASAERQIRFFLIDAPATAFAPLAESVRGRDLLLFNISAPDDALRRRVCAAELVHVIASDRMRMDALAQYLVSRKWRDVLALQGPSEEDARLGKAFADAARKFGARIVAAKDFKPGNDPRQREQNDPALLSAINRDYDVVFVADSAFEFARQLPYRTVRPRPVVGAIQLEPVGWHWTWDHNGAPQVNSRFAAKSGGRHMETADWAAWMAIKMVVQSALHSRSTEFARIRDYLLRDGSFDGDKGLALSLRPWDHQLRQAVLLATDYAVVGAAPLDGFLHKTNVLDTLGDDEPDSPCRLAR